MYKASVLMQPSFVQLYKTALSHKEPPEKLPGQAGLQEELGQPEYDTLLSISGILDRASSVYGLAESAYQVRRELRAGLQTKMHFLHSLLQDFMTLPKQKASLTKHPHGKCVAKLGTIDI